MDESAEQALRKGGGGRYEDANGVRLNALARCGAPALALATLTPTPLIFCNQTPFNPTETFEHM